MVVFMSVKIILATREGFIGREQEEKSRGATYETFAFILSRRRSDYSRDGRRKEVDELEMCFRGGVCRISWWMGCEREGGNTCDSQFSDLIYGYIKCHLLRCRRWGIVGKIKSLLLVLRHVGDISVELLSNLS